MRLIKWLFWLFIALCITGTAFAISQPENVMATPFRGLAVKTLEMTSGIVGIFRSARTIAATYEHSTIEIALQTLKLDENLNKLPAVEIPTNNMSEFPSRELPIYPYYIETKTSQFYYTINDKGELSTSQTDVTVDLGLEQIYTTINRLQNAGRPPNSVGR